MKRELWIVCPSNRDTTHKKGGAFTIYCTDSPVPFPLGCVTRLNSTHRQVSISPVTKKKYLSLVTIFFICTTDRAQRRTCTYYDTRLLVNITQCLASLIQCDWKPLYVSMHTKDLSRRYQELKKHLVASRKTNVHIARWQKKMSILRSLSPISSPFLLQSEGQWYQD